MANDKALREHLVKLLCGAEAHADFEAAVKDMPVELRGKTPKGAEHSAWELLEHLRISQWDILEFSRNPKYQEMKWPDDYWPKSKKPPNPGAWAMSVRGFRNDLRAMAELVSDEGTDLFQKIAWGSGQTILREALLVADHNSYHVGQLILLRRILGAWG